MSRCFLPACKQSRDIPHAANSIARQNGRCSCGCKASCDSDLREIRTVDMEIRNEDQCQEIGRRVEIQEEESGNQGVTRANARLVFRRKRRSRRQYAKRRCMSDGRESCKTHLSVLLKPLSCIVYPHKNTRPMWTAWKRIYIIMFVCKLSPCLRYACSST